VARSCEHPNNVSVAQFMTRTSQYFNVFCLCSGSFEHDNEPSGSTKDGKLLD
jgi:hypothetical protein